MTVSWRFGAVVCWVALSIPVSAGEKPATDAAPTPTVQSDAQTPGQPDPKPPGDPEAQTASAREGDDKIVCKRQEAPVGSRVGGKKVCRTVAEWRRMQDVARETTDEIQSRKIPPPAS